MIAAQGKALCVISGLAVLKGMGPEGGTVKALPRAFSCFTAMILSFLKGTQIHKGTCSKRLRGAFPSQVSVSPGSTILYQGHIAYQISATASRQKRILLAGSHIWFQ